MANREYELEQNNKQDSSAPRFNWLSLCGIRDKLIGIFVIIKVLPLIALALFAAQQISLLGNTFKDESNEMVADTKTLVNTTGTLASESSITALDEKSRESIERLTTDIAAAVADFLYARDKDILQASDLPVTETSYRKFLSIREKKVVYHQDWVLSDDGSKWVPSPQKENPRPAVQPGAVDNKKEFHYVPPSLNTKTKIQSLYHEMTFVDLDGLERLKISATDLLQSGLRNIAQRENTWCKAETYFEELTKLQSG